MERDYGLESLLDMDGFTHVLDSNNWWKIKVTRTEVTKERPHGISYSLTLHNKHNTRIFGMDNAHIPSKRHKGYYGRVVEYDHVHKDEDDKGSPYTFVSAEQLLTDFFSRVEEIEEEISS